MGTLAAGIKDIFATAKTTGSNVMLCGNDGTPDGHMTMDNLASVLGALRGSLKFLGNRNLNGTTDIGWGTYNGDATFENGIFINYQFNGANVTRIIFKMALGAYGQFLGAYIRGWHTV